jgi:hypothetical protein
MEIINMKKLKYVKLFENFDEMVEIINEDNLEIKKIAKDLYLWFKKNGVQATLLASVPGHEHGKKIGDKEYGDNSAFIWYWDDPKTKQTLIDIQLKGDKNKLQEIERLFLSSFTNLEQYNRQFGVTGTSMGVNKKTNFLIFRVKEKTTSKGGLVGNTKTNT